MGNSKVIFGGETVIDLTSDTVAADKMMSGITAHNKAGNKITGTFTLDSEMSAQDTLIANIKTALEGKAAGGGGSGGGAVETCSVQLTYPAKYNLVYTCVESGEVRCKTAYLPAAMTPTFLPVFGHDLSTVVKGSFLVLGNSATVTIASSVTMTGDVELCTNTGDTATVQTSYTVGRVFKINGDCSITITE